MEPSTIPLGIHTRLPPENNGVNEEDDEESVEEEHPFHRYYPQPKKFSIPTIRKLPETKKSQTIQNSFMGKNHILRRESTIFHPSFPSSLEIPHERTWDDDNCDASSPARPAAAIISPQKASPRAPNTNTNQRIEQHLQWALAKLTFFFSGFTISQDLDTLIVFIIVPNWKDGLCVLF